VISRILLCLTLLASSVTSLGEPAANKKPGILFYNSIFKPLIADPKWPRFTLAYQYHMKDVFGRHMFAPNFGAVLPLARASTKDGTTYELSIHGGIFAIMDVGSKPTRLINSDYFGGLALAIQKNKLDYLVRIAHTSAHLGDEFLLSRSGRNITRINLSYETAEAIVAYRFETGLRPYVGLGYIVNAEPKSFRAAEVTLGLDYRSTAVILNGYAKPVFGVYSKTSRNYNWNPTLSIKAGLEFEDKIVLGKALQVLLEYYRGNSIHGQFYKNRENRIGTSLNIDF
jgi:hypothetical protein